MHYMRYSNGDQWQQADAQGAHIDAQLPSVFRDLIACIHDADRPLANGIPRTIHTHVISSEITLNMSDARWVMYPPYSDKPRNAMMGTVKQGNALMYYSRIVFNVTYDMKESVHKYTWRPWKPRSEYHSTYMMRMLPSSYRTQVRPTRTSYPGLSEHRLADERLFVSTSIDHSCDYTRRHLCNDQSVIGAHHPFGQQVMSVREVEWIVGQLHHAIDSMQVALFFETSSTSYMAKTVMGFFPVQHWLIKWWRDDDIKWCMVRNRFYYYYYFYFH